jgi:hypothetical protein
MSMTFDQAVAILRRGPKPGFDGQLEFRVAAVTYGQHDERRRQRASGRHRFRDAAPMKGAPNISGTEPPDFDTELTAGGQRPGSRSGAQLVMRLPGPVTSYFIANDGADGTGLWRHADVESVGVGMGGRKIDTRDQSRRDAAWSRSKLHSIQQANEKFWGLK